jgi:hypothetical protein
MLVICVGSRSLLCIHCSYVSYQYRSLCYSLQRSVMESAEVSYIFALIQLHTSS